METQEYQDFIFVKLSKIHNFLNSKCSFNDLRAAEFFLNNIPKFVVNKLADYEQFPPDNVIRELDLSKRIEINNALHYQLNGKQGLTSRILAKFLGKKYLLKDFESHCKKFRLPKPNEVRSDLIGYIGSDGNLSKLDVYTPANIGKKLEFLFKKYTHLKPESNSQSKDEKIAQRKADYFKILDKNLKIGVGFELDGFSNDRIYEFKTCSINAVRKVLKQLIETRKTVNLLEEHGTFQEKLEEAKTQTEIAAYLLKKDICEVEILDVQRMKLLNLTFKANYNRAKEILQKIINKYRIRKQKLVRVSFP